MNHEIVVTMEIVAMETMEYSFTPDQITYTNISDGITVDLANCETLVLPVSGLGCRSGRSDPGQNPDNGGYVRCSTRGQLFCTSYGHHIGRRCIFLPV